MLLRRLLKAQAGLGAGLEEQNIDPEEFAHSIDETCRQGLGLSFETLAGMNPTELEDLCRNGGRNVGQPNGVGGVSFAMRRAAGAAAGI